MLNDMPSIEELILSGIVEVAGVDSDTGEFLYNFTGKLKDAMPEIFIQRMDFIHEEIVYFNEAGFVDIDDTDSENPTVILTDLAFDDEAVSELPEDKQRTIKELRRLFGEK